MEKVSRNLMNDHTDLLLTLDVLDRICQLLKTGIEVDLVDITRIFYFIKIFADECHHGKEEQILFPAFEKVALKKQKELIKELSDEHQTQRKLLNSIQDSILRDSVQFNTFIQSSLFYINRLRAQILKENLALFPECDTRLSKKKQMEIIKKFEAFENKIIGKGYYPLFHSMIENFERKYLLQIPENTDANLSTGLL